MAASQVFVTDAQMRSSLAVIRSLGKKGITVTAGEETRFATGFFSKYCKSHVVYPSPSKNKEAFADYLLRILKGGDYNVLFPVADACLAPIIDNEREIATYTTIALPQRDIFMQGYDKGITLKTATKSGIPCPKTYFVNNLDEIYGLADNVEYPVVLKPRISSGRRGIEICNSFDELTAKYKKLEVEYNKLLIQEYIPSGGELGVYALFNQASEPRALTVQQRLRSYPVAGGRARFGRQLRTISQRRS